MAVLALEDVSYAYKGKYQVVEAVKHVTCRFGPGRLVVIQGPSGSGKTTLLSLMAGLEAPGSGQVLYNGADLAGLNRDEYRRDAVSVIFQNFNLFPLLTIQENVMYPMELQKRSRREAKTAAAEHLRAVGLDESFYRRYPKMLSGGEQQRVAIARALAAGGKLLLADEPTGNLDEANGLQIIQIMKALAETQAYTVVIITHNPAVLDYADVVYRMHNGYLRQAGPGQAG